MFRNVRQKRASRWWRKPASMACVLIQAAAEIPEMRALHRLYREFELGSMVNAFPVPAEDDMQPLLDFALEFDACMVNVISGVMPIKPEDAVPVVRRWMREAEDRNYAIVVRDTSRWSAQ